MFQEASYVLADMWKTLEELAALLRHSPASPRPRTRTPRRRIKGKQKKRLYRCKGVTLKGKRCKRKQRGHMYCPHHRSQAEEAEALKPFGLKPRATERELKSRYRGLVRQHHPDVGGNPATFRAVNEAYQKAKLVIT